MKRFLFAFLLFFVAMSAKAFDTYTYGNYSYTYTTDNCISLYTYSDGGAETSLVIPSEIVLDDGIHHVTELSQPATGNYTYAFIQNDCKIEELYIPSSIKKVSRIARDLSTLKSVIFENGDNISSLLDTYFFYSKLPFDYIIVFNDTDNNITTKKLVGTSFDKSFKRNTITIKYNNKTSENVNMFLKYSKGEYDTVDNTTFNYLITALQKRGTDLGTISEIDFSNISLNYTHEFTSDITKVLPFGAKVITKNGTFSSATILDKVDFTAPASDITTTISYTRENTQNWNSVCLPFDIQESDFGEGTKIYRLTSATNDEILLSKIADGESIEAGTPCFIYSETETSWNLNLNKTISSNVEAKTINAEGMKLIGSFTKKIIGANKYKLVSDGSAFGPTSSEEATVTPFRCYIELTNQNAPARLNVKLDEEASITIIPDDAAPQKVKLYDLMGRPRKEGTSGLFIKSTR